MSNVRLFCCTFVGVSIANFVGELLTLYDLTDGQSFMQAVTGGIAVVAFAGDRPARKIVEGR